MSDLHGSVHWTELMTRDVDAAKRFYQTICGWTFQAMPMPFGDYWIGSHNGTPTIGIMDMTLTSGSSDMSPFWLTYFGVDDVDVAAGAVVDAGGTVMSGPFDIPAVGRIAIVEDPSGAMVGFMTPAT